MNVVTRGVKNAFRSPLRSGSIILMLAISIGLILSMLVARNSVNVKIEEVKASSGTTITISPAGIRGFSGGGDLLTADDLKTIINTDHISSIIASLSDQMSDDNTDLEASLKMGGFGARQMSGDFDSSSDSNSSSSPDSTKMAEMPVNITIAGTTDADSVSTDGSDLNITSGETFDGSNSDLVALIGVDLAEENDLVVGDTFTAYDETITIVGIFETENTYQDSGMIMPLLTLQNITDQEDLISSVVATADSTDNINTVVSSLEESLGDSIDITSEKEQAEQSVSSLESIASLALAGVIGATIAGAVIVLLEMVMIVRERRREIGVIKAIGGSDFKVISQFISEALSLTFVGAVVGLLLGIAVSGPMITSLVSSSDSGSGSLSNSDKMAYSRPNNSSPDSSATNDSDVQTGGPGDMMRQGINQINTNFTQVTSTLTPETFASAIGITSLIAIIGSAVPAWFIAKVRPSEVLRTE